MIGGDHDGSPLTPRRDQFEEHVGFGLVLGDVGQIVEDEQIELVELCDGGFVLQFPPRDLKLLDKVGRSGEAHAPAVFDRREADSRREMALSAAEERTWRLREASATYCSGFRTRPDQQHGLAAT